MNNKNFIPSVNFHLWQPCNMRCGFCFAKFLDVKKTILPKGHLSKNEAIKVVELLCDYGFEKITFVGGEPTLCPWLSDLIKIAKQKGVITMIVTNGTNLSEDFLSENERYLDWIGISIDSLKHETNKKIGRISKGQKINYLYYVNMIKRIKNYDYRLKMNTVINKFNYEEDLSEFIEYVNPERWKVLKVLEIEGQNNVNFGKFDISDKQFQMFIDKHIRIKSLVKENNNDMIGSYVMIDPSGRFFDNTKGIHTYSKKIIDVGVSDAMKDVKMDFEKFINRKGMYE